MQAADNAVDAPDARNLTDVIEGVEQPGMATAGQNEQAVPGFKPQGKFVVDQVCLLFFRVKKERAAAVFEGGQARNRAADADAGKKGNDAP